MLSDLAAALAMTLALECAFAVLWGVKGRRNYTLLTLANILTNPAVNLLFALSALRMLPTLPVIAVLETGAVLVEWLCYRCRAHIRCPFLFSLCANAFSFCTGSLLQIFF